MNKSQTKSDKKTKKKQKKIIYITPQEASILGYLKDSLKLTKCINSINKEVISLLGNDARKIAQKIIKRFDKS